jgi:hypothetical protein
MNTAEIISIVLGGLTLLGGVFSFALSQILRPFQVSVDNNTKAMDRLTLVTDKHADKIEDHEVRLACIETTHNGSHP